MKKIIMSLFLMFIIVWGNSIAFNLDFLGLGNVFKKKLVGIHFKAGGNNFGGLLFVNGFKSISSHPETISIGPTNNRKNCKEQLKGYYYNSQHGQIIYPLDQETLNYWKSFNNSYYSGLNIVGGFYTLCNQDPDSIYGQIEYQKNGKTIFSIQAGFKYSYTGNNITWKFADNLQKIYKNSSTNIIGLLYDSSLGIGFVGGYVHNKFKNLVNTLNTNKVRNIITSLGSTIGNTVGANITPMYGISVGINLLIQGLLGINISAKNTNYNSSILKYYGKVKSKTIIMKGSIINISKIINKLRKNSSILCRGRWNTRNNLYKISSIDSDIGKTICIKVNNSNIEITNDITINGQTTNIIVDGKNNKLIIKSSQEGPGYINIFVNDGYILFDNKMDKVPLDGNGKIDRINPVTSGAVFNGNLYTKGLITGYSGNSISNFSHRMYIYGSIASLNYIGTNKARKNYITNIGLNKNFIDITKVFNWSCMGEYGTDKVACGNANDKYANDSIVVLKKNYRNKLIK